MDVVVLNGIHPSFLDYIGCFREATTKTYLRGYREVNLTTYFIKAPTFSLGLFFLKGISFLPDEIPLNEKAVNLGIGASNISARTDAFFEDSNVGFRNWKSFQKCKISDQIIYLFIS